MNLQEAFDAGFEAVKAYVDGELAAFDARIKAMESREPEKVEIVKEIDPEALAALVAQEVERAVADIPPAEPGKSVTVEDVAPLISEQVSAVVSEAVKAIPPAEPGKDADPDETKALVDAMVRDAVAALPSPQPGKSVTVEDMRPVVDEAVALAVKALPQPKDGVGLASAVIDRDGALILTLTDGATKEMGRVVGRDADMQALRDEMRRMFDELPKPKDGVDGLGFDDLTVDYDGERGITFRMERSDQVKEFKFEMPIVLDRGVWSEKREGGYAKGDFVTWGGSGWIATKDTDGKPDSGDGWRLAIKKGRDYRPAGEAR